MGVADPSTVVLPTGLLGFFYCFCSNCVTSLCWLLSCGGKYFSALTLVRGHDLGPDSADGSVPSLVSTPVLQNLLVSVLKLSTGLCVCIIRAWENWSKLSQRVCALSFVTLWWVWALNLFLKCIPFAVSEWESFFKGKRKENKNILGCDSCFWQGMESISNMTRWSFLSHRVLFKHLSVCRDLWAQIFMSAK